jgi:hypothetical protein
LQLAKIISIKIEFKDFHKSPEEMDAHAHSDDQTSNLHVRQE